MSRYFFTVTYNDITLNTVADELTAETHSAASAKFAKILGVEESELDSPVATEIDLLGYKFKSDKFLKALGATEEELEFREPLK